MASVLHVFSLGMWRKYTFLPIFSCLLAGLAWWSVKSDHSGVSHFNRMPSGVVAHSPAHSPDQSIDEPTQESLRRDLLEALDYLAQEELSYHSREGHFSYVLLHKVWPKFGSLASKYEIRIAEASEDRFLISAFSEENGKIVDSVTLDHNFSVRANFPIPPPRPEYLGMQVMRNLMRLKNTAHPERFAEETVYKGFFKYALKTDPRSGRYVIAEGQLEPVDGLRIVLDQAGQKLGPSSNTKHWQNILNPVALSRKVEETVSGNQEYFSPSVTSAVKKLVIEEIPEVKRR